MSLLAAVALSTLAHPADLDTAFLRFPDLHGDRVVFQREGDLWLGDLATGRAVRVTTDPGLESFPRFSPDGTQLAFRGQYDGGNDVFVMPVAGGPPKRLTYNFGFGQVSGWTPDGKDVVYRFGNTPYAWQAHTVPAAGGAPTRLPLEFVSDLAFGGDGRFAFTRFIRWNSAWFFYTGGMANQVWVGDPKAKRFRALTDLPGTNEFPHWAGDRVYFVNEDKGRFRIMSVPSDGGRPKVEAGPYDVEIRHLNGDAQRLVYEKGTVLEVLDLGTGRATEPRFDLDSDLRYTRPYDVPAQDAASFASLTPTGKRVLVEARGQIVSLPVGEGEARVWKAQDGVRLRRPMMSPDARRVAYTSDEGGQDNVWVADADGSGAKRLTGDSEGQLTTMAWSPDSAWLTVQDSAGRLRLIDAASGRETVVTTHGSTWNGVPTSFSPDSKWLAYTRPTDFAGVSQVHVFEVATGRSTLVSDGMAEDSQVSFSRDGRFLAVLTNRAINLAFDPFQDTLTASNPTVVKLYRLRADVADPFAPEDPEEKAKEDPKPADAPKEEPKKPAEPTFSIEFEGMAGRRVEVPVPAGGYGQVAVVGDRVLVAGDGRVSFYDLKAKQFGTVVEGAGGFQLSADGTKLLVGAAGALRVVDVTGRDQRADAGRVAFGGLNLRIDPRAEWTQIYWDAWRLSRDYFYVANMHGADWPAVGRKYAQYLPAVRHRSELNELIRWTQSELGSSHQYLGGGDEQNLKRLRQAASLGIDVEPDASGYYRISRIVRGDGYRTGERSPFADPSLGVTEGTYLIEVAGVPARVGEDFMARLVGRAGQVVTVKVNDRPSAEGAKTVRVRPVGSDERMRYLDWVRQNREYVTKASGGRVGYVHLDAMGNGDFADFLKQYYPQRDKDALLIDTRFNTGGWVQDIINRILARRLTGFFNQRNNPRGFTRQSDYFPGPMATLQNEFNFSCGEEFPHRFRDLKLGPVIGRRTGGGEVGSSPGWPLVDGGVISVPNYGMYTEKDGWVIEGPGVEPDIDVPSDPNLFVQGKDPQLDRGVAWLLDELKRRPPVRPKAPADPVRARRP